MLLALALSSVVEASDVATTKKFGIGVASGPFAISATGKFYLSEKSGIAAYLGSSGIYHGARVNFESEFVEFGDWDFGRLDMYWDAGVDVGLWTYFGYTGAQIGVGGGVGIELQFNKVPASVFVDVGLGVYPLNLCSGYGAYAGFCLISPRGAAGGRWYF
ncbi:MAG: hypothetical protein V4850_18995 [Myxococcota bacterium]